jgi:RNA polymerase sigma-70 factor (ECF subfamily)
MRGQKHDLEQADDRALMVLYANGDADAVRILTARLLPRAYRHALRVLQNKAEADDIAQEAMLRLWRSAPDWHSDGAARPSTWVHKVVANLIIDRFRKSARDAGGYVALDEADDPVDPAPSAETHLTQQARFSALDAALAHLPERQRQAVVLRHIEGCSNPEIAEILGIGVEAVESLTARGKRALKTALATQQEALSYGT